MQKKTIFAKNLKRFIKIFIFLFLIYSVFLAVSIGSVKIEIKNVVNIFLKAMGFNIETVWTQNEEIIILKLRLPRVLTALIVGALLGVAGVASQVLFKNPIADPYIIGISSSASFGAVLSLVLELHFLGKFTTPLISFIVTLLSIGMIYMLSKTKYGISITTLLLSGIAVSFVFSALISLVLYLSVEKSHMILSILMGKFWGSSWDELQIIIIIALIPLTILYFYAMDLNLMLLGDTNAQSMGVNIKTTKIIILVCMTLITATAVSFCGIIGFVGLIIPNSMRLLVGNDHKKLIPYSAAAGALLLIWADTVARTIIAPMEIPVGIFTSLLGGPFFIFLILKKKRMGIIE